jgi:hypothetical protein
MQKAQAEDNGGEQPNARCFFSIVVGASDRPGCVRRAIPWKLIASPFGGAMLPVNPKHVSVLGIIALLAFGMPFLKV